MFGYAEASVGIGLTVGTALGSFVYSLFGYLMVFYSFAIIAAFILFLCYIMMPNSLNSPEEY
jgi:predicted MFS family arabinose efflux permease